MDLDKGYSRSSFRDLVKRKKPKKPRRKRCELLDDPPTFSDQEQSRFDDLRRLIEEGLSKYLLRKEVKNEIIVIQECIFNTGEVSRQPGILLSCNRGAVKTVWRYVERLDIVSELRPQSTFWPAFDVLVCEITLLAAGREATQIYARNWNGTKTINAQSACGIPLRKSNENGYVYGTLGGLITVKTGHGNVAHYGITTGHFCDNRDASASSDAIVDIPNHRQDESESSSDSDHLVHTSRNSYSDTASASDVDEADDSEEESPHDSSFENLANDYNADPADLWTCFGHVKTTSYNRMDQNHDWALIELDFDPRQARLYNCTPAWAADKLLDRSQLKRNLPNESVEQIESRKVGIARTRLGQAASWGQLERGKVRVMLASNAEFIDAYRVTLNDTKGLAIGDSGAWVFDAQNGKVIGSVFGLDTFRKALVMPMAVCLQAIKKALDATSVKLYDAVEHELSVASEMISIEHDACNELKSNTQTIYSAGITATASGRSKESDEIKEQELQSMDVYALNPKVKGDHGLTVVLRSIPLSKPTVRSKREVSPTRPTFLAKGDQYETQSYQAQYNPEYGTATPFVESEQLSTSSSPQESRTLIKQHAIFETQTFRQSLSGQVRTIEPDQDVVGSHVMRHASNHESVSRKPAQRTQSEEDLNIPFRYLVNPLHRHLVLCPADDFKQRVTLLEDFSELQEQDKDANLRFVQESLNLARMGLRDASTQCACSLVLLIQTCPQTHKSKFFVNICKRNSKERADFAKGLEKLTSAIKAMAEEKGPLPLPTSTPNTTDKMPPRRSDTRSTNYDLRDLSQPKPQVIMDPARETSAHHELSSLIMAALDNAFGEGSAYDASPLDTSPPFRGAYGMEGSVYNDSALGTPPSHREAYSMEGSVYIDSALGTSPSLRGAYNIKGSVYDDSIPGTPLLLQGEYGNMEFGLARREARGRLIQRDIFQKTRSNSKAYNNPWQSGDSETVEHDDQSNAADNRRIDEISRLFADRDTITKEKVLDTGRLESEDPKVKQLSAQFKQQKGKSFFRSGRVFAILWHESTGSLKDEPLPVTEQLHEPSSPSLRNVTSRIMGQDIYSHIRRMVVIKNSHGHCWCVSISTYGGRGLFKRGLSTADYEAHTIIHASNEEPVRLQRKIGKNIIWEPTSGKRPIRVEMAKDQTLDKASRVHFGKPYTVEWNVPVMDVGQVVDEDFALLKIYATEQLFG